MHALAHPSRGRQREPVLEAVRKPVARKDSREVLSAKARDKGVDLGIDIGPTARAAFRGDPTRIRQILLNLVGNGIKFTEEGFVAVKVCLVPNESDEVGNVSSRVRFQVSDSGIGMREDVRARMFRKFSQADSSITRRYGGTGLGLAISKQLVELMGGEIGVESQFGMGSKFWFEIPLTVSTAPHIGGDALPPMLKGVRVLVADDIDMNLEIFRRQLGGFGMEVFCCRDGFDALAELQRAWHRGMPYDIAFLDQMMPGLCGSDLARRIRAIAAIADVRLVLVSSAGPHGLTGEAAKVFDAILDKPVRQRDLVECLAKLCAPPSERMLTEPIADAHESALEKAEASPSALRILVAEDNKINQKFLLALLGKAGHTVDVVENGHLAIDAVQRVDYDVVLMDVQMPELDGVEATKQIRLLPKPKSDVPIIGLTAHAMSGAREQYIAAGMDDYISKPVQPLILLSKLESLSLASSARIVRETGDAIGEIRPAEACT